MPRSLLALLLALVAFATTAQAQSGEPRRVVLADGSVLVGIVVDENADPVVLTTERGVEQRIPRSQIVEITPLLAGRFSRIDPTRTRLVLSPTGRTLGAGRKRVGTLAYIIPQATVGLNDRVDLSGTVGLAFGGDSFTLVPVLGGKVGIVDTGSFAAAVGANLGTVLGQDTGGAFVATPYAAVTVGDEVRSVSASVTGLIGGSVEAGDIETADGALLGLGGEIQVSNRIKLLLDSVIPVGQDEGGVFVAPGVRFFGDQFSVDVFGVIASVDGEVGGFAPIANFTYSF